MHRRTANPLSVPALAVAAGLACAGAGAELPQEWDIQLIARSSLNPGIPAFNMPQGSSLSSQYVALDEDGSVAIRVVLSTPNATEGIFRGNADGGGLIASVDSGDPFWSVNVANRSGRVALSFLAQGAGAETRDTEGNLVQEFPAGGTEGVANFSSITLTADGAIGYRGAFGFNRKHVVDEFIDGTRSQRLVATDAFGPYSFIFSPTINDAKHMASKVLIDGGPQAVLRWDENGDPTTIVETGPTYNAIVNSTHLAQDGTVAFTARRSADSVWEVRASDGVTSTLIAEGGQMNINNGSLANFGPVANSSGLVAFRATQGPSTALFVGDGADLVRIIGPGDTVETDLGTLDVGFDFGGTTGVQIMNGVVDINDNNQVAFAAFLENGTIGVFVATPAAADPGCSPADLAEPFGVLDIFDVLEFLSLFEAEDPRADLAKPFGVFDIFDVLEFLAVFEQGCP